MKIIQTKKAPEAIGSYSQGVKTDRYIFTSGQIGLDPSTGQIVRDDLEAEMIQIMKSLGLSGDFKNYYRTDSEDYRKFTQETFIDLWKII